MKKILILALLVISFSFTACGVTENKEIPKETKIEQTHENDKFLKTVNFNEANAKIIAEKLSNNIKFESTIEKEKPLVK